MFTMNLVPVAAAAMVMTLMGPPQSQTPDSAWQRTSDAAGRFSLLAPGAMKADPPKTDADGITTYSFAVRIGRTAYVLVYADGATANADREMSDARDALFKGLNAVVVTEHRFKATQPTGDQPAAEFTGHSSSLGADVKARTVWHNGRLYMLGVISPTGTTSVLDVDKFLNSFTITGSSKDR